MVWSKIKKNYRNLGKISVVTIIFSLFPMWAVNAIQARSLPNGISVSPVVEQISLHDRQNSATFTALFTNNTDNEMFVRVSSRDFTASSDGSRLLFIDNISSNSHGLSGSLQVDKPQFNVLPHKSQKVTVTILNASNLAPGGHYAALIFGARSVSNRHDKTVSVREAVSCLVFVNTFGGGTQTTTLVALPFGGFRTSLPQNVSIVLSNTGNTPTVPRGYTQIIGPREKLYSQSTVNTDSSMILPGSKRLFPISLTQTGGNAWFGMYHLKIFYRHDGQANYALYDKKFLVISPPVLITLGLFVALVAGLLIRYFKPKPKSNIVQKPAKKKYIDIIKH